MLLIKLAEVQRSESAYEEFWLSRHLGRLSFGFDLCYDQLNARGRQKLFVRTYRAVQPKLEASLNNTAVQYLLRGYP